MKNHTSLCLAIASTLALTLFTAAAADEMDASKLPPASTKSGVTFEKDMKPLFEKSCNKCHGEQRHKNNLRLDSLEAAVKGGKDGPDIVAGKSGKSPLVYAVARVGDDEGAFMPPPESKSKVPPLTKEQIGLIRAWIDQGAK